MSSISCHKSQTVGGVPANTDELLKAVAREAGGNVHTFIESIDLQPGDFKVVLVILPAPPTTPGSLEANPDA
jgi:hypothetical protein